MVGFYGVCGSGTNGGLLRLKAFLGPTFLQPARFRTEWYTSCTYGKYTLLVCLSIDMIGRATIARHGRRSLQAHSRLPSCRSLASAASGSFNYETGDAAGVKFASRDLPGPTTHLAVVAKAGTRYEPLPGFSEGLDKFAFKNTNKRSALRITRESELLGGECSSYHSRENLVLSTKFLRDDLPYFAELLGEVIAQTKYSGRSLCQPHIEHSSMLTGKQLMSCTKKLKR